MYRIIHILTGLFAIILTICNVSLKAQPCQVNPSFDYVQFCDSVEFTNTSTVLSGTVTGYQWDFGDGFTSVLENPTHTFLNEGEFYVNLKVFHSSGCDTTAIDTVYLSIPIAGFWADTVCFGVPTMFHDTSTTLYGIIDMWEWDFGDGTSNIQNPFHPFTTQGLQEDVQLIVSNSLGCYDTTSHDVLVDSLPYVDFSYTPACLDKEMCFYSESVANSDSITNWTWIIDFTTTIEGEDTICWTFSTIGEHYIILTILNSNGCQSSLIDTVIVDYPPMVDFIASEVCFGDTTFFINESDTQGVQIANWLWNFGDPGSGTNTSALYEPTHLFSAEGGFNVQLIAENIHGCLDSIVKPVIVDSIPEAFFTVQDIAVGVETEFFDNSIPHGSPIVSTFWDFGDGTTANNPNPVYHTYLTTGTYDVLFAVCDANNCCDTVIIPINVTGYPFADFSYVPVDLTATFTDESIPVLPSIPIDKWFWDFGDLSVTIDTSSNQNPSYTYPELGYYDVFLEITDINGGIDDTTITIYVGDALRADFKHLSGCTGGFNTFIDKSDTSYLAGIKRWYWDFGDEKDTTYYTKADTIWHSYSQSGLYPVMLIIYDNEFGNPVISDTIIDTVSVYVSPVAKFDSVGVCFGDPTKFIDLSEPNGPAITQWYWEFGDGSYAYNQNPTHLYNSVGTYLVSLRVTNTIGCTDTVSSMAFVNLAPNPYFEILDKHCINSPIRFRPFYDSLSTIVTEWTWYFDFPKTDSLNISHEQYPTHVYGYVDEYRIKLVASASGCEQDTSTRILAYPIPYGEFNYIENYQKVNGRTQFINESIYATKYLWDFGNGNTSTETGPIEVYEEDSTYIVTMIAYNEYGCSDTSVKEIEVYFKGLYLPSAFSPNNPNKDISLFTPKGINIKELLVQVFDLKGNLLWETTKVDQYGRPSESWDGYHEGRLMPSATYVWKAKATFRDGTFWEGTDLYHGDELVRQGTVTIIR